MVSLGENAFEKGACILSAANGSQRIDVPEGADGERRLRKAEIIGRSITKYMVATSQSAADQVECGDEARVRSGDQPQLLQQQQARIDLAPTQFAGEGVDLPVPGLIQQAMPDRLGLLAPILGPLILAEGRGDLSRAVAGCPAECYRMGMDRHAGAKFPDSGIGFERFLDRFFPKFF